MEPEGSLPRLQEPVTCHYPDPDQSSTYRQSHFWRSVMILSSHLRLNPPSGLFSSDFPTKTMYASLLSPIHTTCPAHLILFDLITRIISGEEYKSLSSSLFNFLHSRLSRPSWPKYSPQQPLSQTPSSYVRPSMSATKCYTHKKTKGKIVGLFILIFIFLASQLEDNRFCTEWWQAIPDLILRLIFSWIEFWLVRVVPKHLKCSTSSKELLSVFI